MVHGKAPTASVAVATMVIPQHEEEEDEEVSVSPITFNMMNPNS